MKSLLKKMLPLITLILLCTVKLDVQAEKVWNTSGEKNPWGGDYDYKYWTGSSWSYYGDGTIKEEEFIDITYDVTYDYEEAYKMLEYVNAERRKVGAPELIMKDELMDVAMQRAAETVIYWEHTRPDGSDIQSLSYYIFGENLHRGARTAEGANYSLAHSNGHYENMIDSQWKYVGFGCVKSNEKYFWVQVFSVEHIYHEDGYDAPFHYKNDVYDGTQLVYCPHSPNDKPILWDEMTSGNRRNYTDIFTTKINPKLYSSIDVSLESEYVMGEESEVIVNLHYTCRGKSQFSALPAQECNISFSNVKLCEATDKGFRCLKPGTTTVTFTMKDYPILTVSKDITIVPRYGYEVICNNCRYMVNSSDERTVSFIKSTKAKKITIPNTIKIANKNYKVTDIADGAFKGNKKVKEVSIGKNVTRIGHRAFEKCSNLKKITVKSSKLKSVGVYALKGIHKKATIKVPKSKLSKYKKLFKNKGQKKTVKITK